MNLNHEIEFGITVLHVACLYSSYRVIRYLEANSADLAARTAANGTVAPVDLLGEQERNYLNITLNMDTVDCSTAVDDIHRLMVKVMLLL